jgi:hypothetical protein
MEKNAFMFVAIGALATLTGCKEDEQSKAAAAPVQTVEWFKAHKIERDAQLSKCNSNPGELMITPNCVNASQAASTTTWSARSGVKGIKPITAQDIRDNNRK